MLAEAKGGGASGGGRSLFCAHQLTGCTPSSGLRLCGMMGILGSMTQTVCLTMLELLLGWVMQCRWVDLESMMQIESL